MTDFENLWPIRLGCIAIDTVWLEKYPDIILL